LDKRTKIILGLFVAVLIGIVITEVVRPQPLNWKQSYTAADKIPFGCFVLYNELPSLFETKELVTVKESMYSFLLDRDSTEQSNYIMINNRIELDEQEYNQLLSHVTRGNDVFIAAGYFGYRLSDTLNIEMDAHYTIREDTVQLSVTNESFKASTFHYTKGMYNRHFASVDTLNTTILGHLNYIQESYLDGNEKEIERREPNFIKVKFGKGNFYLNSTPLAYTNFYMLEGNQDYVANTFSYLKNREQLYWDNYKKSGRIVIDSPLRFILNQTALKWAYYLCLISLLLFYIFRTKRKQRAIPVVEPLPNSSVDFAQTVGSLYYQHKDYSNLIAKKLNYFLSHIRNNFYIDTVVINEKTAKKLAAKSGKSLSDVTALMNFVKHLKNKTHHSESDLIELNKKITSFKK